ncbi:MAG: hypothetical protein IT450_07910 [Phycisphaerales bacterium]|nr:hypothetical protein [Phycisphaerales bacterium]
MTKMLIRLRPLLVGGTTLGLIQGLGQINYNSLLFQFLGTWINILVALIFGGDLSNFNNGNMFN